MEFIIELRETLKYASLKSKIYTGTINKYSFRIEDDKMIPTIMLRDIKDQSGKIITDHLWKDKFPLFTKYKRYDIVEFEGVPEQYTKSNNELEYGLKINKIIGKVN